MQSEGAPVPLSNELPSNDRNILRRDMSVSCSECDALASETFIFDCAFHCRHEYRDSITFVGSKDDEVASAVHAEPISNLLHHSAARIAHGNSSAVNNHRRRNPCTSELLKGAPPRTPKKCAPRRGIFVEETCLDTSARGELTHRLRIRLTTLDLGVILV